MKTFLEIKKREEEKRKEQENVKSNCSGISINHSIIHIWKDVFGSNVKWEL